MLGGRIHRLSIAFTALVLAATAVVFWLTESVHAHTDQSLLRQEVEQAAAAVANQVPTVQAQLVDAAEVAVNTDADVAVFKRFVTPKLSAGGPFGSMSLWLIGHGPPRELASVGAAPVLVSDHLADRFLSTVHPSPRLFLTDLFPGSPERLGYAEMPPGDRSGLVVYAERVVPGPKRVSAIGSYYGAFALYLGKQQVPGALLESTQPLPLRGQKAVVQIPFGDKVMTLVGARTTGLAGSLAASTPWILLGAGVVLALFGGSTVEFVTRRRILAERLALENQRRYLDQRQIAAELQRALLPTLPEVDGVEIAGRYYSGVEGTEVGGDWYDVVATGDNHCVLVVGDVSGRGLRAASAMASLRFALRAYLIQGDPVEEALGKLGSHLDVDIDHQFATVLAAEIDVPGRRMSIVSAGHLLPLIVNDGTAQYVSGSVDAPIGVRPSIRPTTISVDLGEKAKVIFFSDGLVERSGEMLDVGLERLRTAALRASADITGLVDGIASDLVPDEAHDDTIIMGVQWTK